MFKKLRAMMGDAVAGRRVRWYGEDLRVYVSYADQGGFCLSVAHRGREVVMDLAQGEDLETFLTRVEEAACTAEDL